MARKILALDLGSNSIGWALIEQTKHGDLEQIDGIGVRVFPEGVDRDQQGAEHPKMEQRRIARGTRRQIARRSRRKNLLRRVLLKIGLLPKNADEQRELDQIDPYELRRRALTEKLSLHEIGRMFVHLNQRRGFLSNRKTDKAKAKETEGMLKEINELAAEMGDRSLGEFMAERRASQPLDRIRGKHTHRKMYETEFDRIWAKQAEFYPGLLTDRLKYGRRGPQAYPRKPEPLTNRDANSLLDEFGLHGILFFQRAMYWPKSVVGQCELEPKLKRCRRADRAAQRFRLLQEVNNLRIIPARGQPRPLSIEERDKTIELLAKKKECSFDDLRMKLRLFENDGFNLEIGERRKLLGMPTDALLASKKLFGPAWHKRSEAEKTELVRCLIAAETDESERERFRARAGADWGCTSELAEELLAVNFDDGHAAFSRVAIEKLLRHLERGLRLMGNDASDSALHAAGYLRPDERAIRQRDSLPPVPEDITNPLVRQAIFEVRKLVNTIIREFGMPDAIHIELAREVQGGLRQRQEYTARIRERERRRDDAADRIRELGFKPSRDAINRYLLWKEQGEFCIYSGRAISPNQLFGGEVDVDHILPESRSLDNSLMNKVVCFRSENEDKANRTPFEWLAERQPRKYEDVLQRVAQLPIEVRNAKRQKFTRESVELDEFINRQLTDTAYITRKVREYVQCLGCDIVCTKGQCTAELRHMWGLDSVLRDDGLDLKNREDHRHHAVDALVIALTDRSRLQALARARTRDDGEVLPEPCPRFRDLVEEQVNCINISHRVARKVAGALHEETIYGPTSKPRRAAPSESVAADRPHARGWVEDTSAFVYRKPLEALTAAMIDDIRDPQVKELVIARLREHNIDYQKKAKIPKEVWQHPLRMVRKAGRKQDADGPIIRKVRLIKCDLTIQPIRGGTAYVKPGSTHHICLFDLPGSTTQKPKRDMIAVSMLEAAARANRGEPIIQRQHPREPNSRFLFSLSRGEAIRGTIKGRSDLFVFRTAASTQGQIYFVSHTDARPSAEVEKFVAKANTLRGEKVAVDVLGRIRRAND
jgi:CRISPR-associated endonuclease Csn1